MISACQALLDSISVWEMPAAKSPLTASTHCSYIILHVFALWADGEQQAHKPFVTGFTLLRVRVCSVTLHGTIQTEILEHAMDSPLLKKYKVTSWQFFYLLKQAATSAQGKTEIKNKLKIKKKLSPKNFQELCYRFFLHYKDVLC